jgi:hypothetical protein
MDGFKQSNFSAYYPSPCSNCNTPVKPFLVLVLTVSILVLVLYFADLMISGEEDAWVNAKLDKVSNIKQTE